MTDELRLEERLKLAGEEFGCDKVSPHGYHVYYANHLEVYQSRDFKLLEIGIGGEGRELGGASLKMWEKVFDKADIYGLDIYPKSELDASRIKTFIVDQGDPVALNEFASRYGPFDVVIDDGSHLRADQLTSLFNLMAHIVPGGYYVMEDYFTAYWPVYDGSTLAKDFLDTPVRWLKQAIDIINRNNLLSEDAKLFVPDWQVEELHVYPGVAFIKKGLHAVRSEIPTEEFQNNQIELDELRYGEYKNLFFSYIKDPMFHLALLKSIKQQLDEKISGVENAIRQGNGKSP
jgi:hypothetical protein